MILQKFYVETFGCTANTSATELMTYLLNECGYEKVSDLHDADFVLINTCIVKAPTENKIKDQLVKTYQKKPLIVAGCLPQVLDEWCTKNIPEAALIGVDHFGDVCLAAKSVLANESFESLSRDKNFCLEAHRIRDRRLTGIIEISKGCTGQCAYCIVRIAKGLLISKSKEQITKEAQLAISEGCKELWVTAQDTASYGVDINSSLPEIVDEITNLEGDFMVRIGMLNADYALPIIKKLKSLLQNPNVYTFLHIPLQSGSDQVLEKMKRKYTINEFRKLINELRNSVNLTLSTDIITGFPGETEEDFIQTTKLLDELQFDIVNISKYGDRKGTVASKSKDKLPTEVVKERSSKLTVQVSKMTLERNKKWVGWKGSALALRRDKDPNQTLLRNKFYKLIAINDSTLELGKWYNVEIVDARKTRLIGSLV